TPCGGGDARHRRRAPHRGHQRRHDDRRARGPVRGVHHRCRRRRLGARAGPAGGCRPVTMVAALLGALVGFGLVVLVLALVGVEPGDLRPRIGGPRTRGSLFGIQGATQRMLLALAGFTLVGLVTRWPIAALYAGLAGWFLPSIVGGKAAREGQIARIEAIASWAEMLRDTMAGAGGLEQSI